MRMSKDERIAKYLYMILDVNGLTDKELLDNVKKFQRAMSSNVGYTVDYARHGSEFRNPIVANYKTGFRHDIRITIEKVV